MASKQPNQQLDQYVINPYTGRLIKKASKTYQRLLSARLLEEDAPSTAQENLILEADSPAQAKVIQTKMNKNIQKNKVITRRGNKVLKASRRPTRTEQIDKITDYAVSSLVENKDELMDSDLTDEEMDAYIRKVIQQKLVGIPESANED
jgi:hypothetical protein